MVVHFSLQISAIFFYYMLERILAHPCHVIERSEVGNENAQGFLELETYFVLEVPQALNRNPFACNF